MRPEPRKQLRSSLCIRSMYDHISANHIARQCIWERPWGLKTIYVFTKSRTCVSIQRPDVRVLILHVIFFVPYVQLPNSNLNPGSNSLRPFKIGYVHPANPIPNLNSQPLLGIVKQKSRTDGLQHRPDKHKGRETRCSVTAERRG
jgi:hypothetical protein